MSLTLNSDGQNISMNIEDFVNALSPETKKIIVELLAWDVLEDLERHLKGQTDYYGYTGGETTGRLIREKALAVQGIEPEYKKDLERELAYEKSQKEYYKQNSDFYWKLHHALGYEWRVRIEKETGVKFR